MDRVFSCSLFTWTLIKERSTTTRSIGDLQLYLNNIVQSKSSLQVETLHRHNKRSRRWHPTFWMGLQKHLPLTLIWNKITSFDTSMPSCLFCLWKGPMTYGGGKGAPRNTPLLFQGQKIIFFRLISSSLDQCSGCATLALGEIWNPHEAIWVGPIEQVQKYESWPQLGQVNAWLQQWCDPHCSKSLIPSTEKNADILNIECYQRRSRRGRGERYCHCMFSSNEWRETKESTHQETIKMNTFLVSS